MTKEGKVIIIALSHKNGRTILKFKDIVTENDVEDFDACVKNGKIIPNAATKKLYDEEVQKLIDAKAKKVKDAEEKRKLLKKANDISAEALALSEQKVMDLTKELEGEKNKFVNLETKSKTDLEAKESIIKLSEQKVMDLTKELEILKAKDTDNKK